MLDLKFIRESPDVVRDAIQAKNEKADVDLLLRLDRDRRGKLSQVEELKHRRNVVSKEIGKLKQAGQDTEIQTKEMKEVSENIKAIDLDIANLDKEISNIHDRIPNIPHESVPIGNETKNEEVKTWGKKPKFDFQPKTHWDLGESLGLFDFDAAAKISGSNFALFRGMGARLQRALVNFMLDLHTDKHGYEEIDPPYIVRRDTMYGTGQLPKLEEDMYLIEQDDLFLIPTAEVPVTNLYRNQVIDGFRLPLYYTAYTPCFRREAGSYGRDTRGLIRVHQFDKVEMVKFVRPENSYDELEKLLENAEEVLQLLKLPYRVLNLASGDLSFAAAKCYDIEVWAPGVDRFLEVSSVSNFVDFQARRASIRFRRTSDAKPEFIHTLNGSGLALPRTVIAIIENYQTDEGTVLIPEPLQAYMQTDVIKNR